MTVRINVGSTPAASTGIKVVLRTNVPKAKNANPDGPVRIDYNDMHYDFAVIFALLNPTEMVHGLIGRSPIKPMQIA